MDWRSVHRGDAPLIVAVPHGGTGLAGLADAFVSPWRARLDTDWWVGALYAFVRTFGATTVATGILRSVIAMNRDPTGAPLYPAPATTELCPPRDEERTVGKAGDGTRDRWGWPQI